MVRDSAYVVHCVASREYARLMQDECLAGITDAIQSTHRPLPSRSVSVVVKASSSSVDAAALSRRAVVGTGLAFAAAVAARGESLGHVDVGQVA